MKLKNTLSGLDFLDDVPAQKRSYSVFRNKAGDYVLCSQKRMKIWEGDFAIVKHRAVDQLARRLRGQTGLTATTVANRTRRAPLSRFDVLNRVYVLIALGRAKVDRRFKGRAMHFNVMG